MNEANVSVVIPCFNCDATIDRAVKSVVDQTMRVKEIILVNDESTDATYFKLIEMQKQWPDLIEVVNLAVNTGPATARNIGWDKANGEYIAFLDADDAWHIDKIFIQYCFMKKNFDCSLSAHLSSEVNSSPVNEQKKILAHGYDVSKIGPFQLMISNTISTRSVMIKSNIPYRFTPGGRYSEDIALWLEMALDNVKMQMINLTLAYSFKAAYGDGGQTQFLWRMQKGSYQAFYNLFLKKKLPLYVLVPLLVWSSFKFLRRLIKVIIKK